METQLKLDILPQPDNFTCGPTCLHALYRFHNMPLPLERIIAEVPKMEGGGTIAVLLACHALKHGLDAIIYTYNLEVFDPTWFTPTAPPLADRLKAQMAAKESPRLQSTTEAYLEFLRLGGVVRMEDLNSDLIRKHLTRGIPILTGLSATFLYRDAREHLPPLTPTPLPQGERGRGEGVPDDIRGVPAGHFVVLCGYDRETRNVLVADPFMPNPLAAEPLYELHIGRVVNAILLGILTHDANLLVLQPRKPVKRRVRADRHRGQ